MEGKGSAVKFPDGLAYESIEKVLNVCSAANEEEISLPYDRLLRENRRIYGKEYSLELTIFKARSGFSMGEHKARFVFRW